MTEQGPTEGNSGPDTGQTRSEGGSCDETTAKKVIITLQRAMTKKKKRSSGKIGVTPSVATPGDTNPSDATVANYNFITNRFYAATDFERPFRTQTYRSATQQIHVGRN